MRVKPKPKAKTKTKTAPKKKVVLLSGGNPQIAMADGDAPVKAYLAAMPGWKRAIGKQVDELVVATLPGVAKAVKWNSPMWGVPDNGFFLSIHCFTRFVRLTFFRGTALTPPPPGPSKIAGVRYLDVKEGDALDTKQLADWFRQAASRPGWIPGTPM